MKTKLTLLNCGVVLSILALAATITNRQPINLGFLQSNFDGNAFAFTNASSVASSNFVVVGITNQIVFGSTNPPPAITATPAAWISVRVTGVATNYVIPVYQ